ncbi:MAG: molybdenum cofactor biosynthesis protein MoaE [Deltaproteobacteria bacterium]|nr:molybdenum cofactor biosynthesis protein MoaE [Deltaproteobacteria bacterium]MBW2117180.1 molybdenum cofactor biosynthesis protein MoaE [Deltaproteobacteria bacterium]MBW2343665.1 molybdenum cofactor biosynthesis protein MoaE [Deltaproteobacteria bacterium]
MDLNKTIQTLKEHPDYPKMGMIASHLGVVRKTSLNGRPVTGIEVMFDEDIIQKTISDIEKMSGIVKVIVETNGGTLNVGDEIMAVVVGGDTREHVFPALMTAVDRIKTECSRKKELF